MEQLYDARGRRKHLAGLERNRFLKAARSTDTPVRAFCEVLAVTGWRLSEALSLTSERVDGAGSDAAGAADCSFLVCAAHGGQAAR